MYTVSSLLYEVASSQVQSRYLLNKMRIAYRCADNYDVCGLPSKRTMDMNAGQQKGSKCEHQSGFNVKLCWITFYLKLWGVCVCVCGREGG